MLDEEEVVLEEDLIVPDKVVVECLPVQPEYNDSQNGHIDEVFFSHGCMLISRSFFCKQNWAAPREKEAIWISISISLE
jgi:hypothetical protein